MRMTYMWLAQLFTGLLILILSVAHVVSIHLRAILRLFGVEQPVSTAASTQPGAGSWAFFLVVISAAILVHALFGLRQVAAEMAPSAGKLRAISWTVAAFGIILLAGAAVIPAFLASR